MIHRFSLIAALAMLSVSSFAMANFKQSDWELTLAGSGANDDSFNSGGASVNAGLGYFLSDDFEVVLRQGLGFTSGPGNNSWSGSTRVAIDYHFNLDKWRPFVGANIGYIYGDDTSDTWAAAPEAGVKYFVNDTTFITAMVEYQFFFRNIGDAGDAFNDGQFVYSLGIGFRFN